MSTLSYHFPELAIGAVYPFGQAVEASDQQVRSECRAKRFPATVAVRRLRASGPPRPGRTVTAPWAE